MTDHVPVPRENKSAAASMVTYKIGGRAYPLRARANCRVCQSVFRFDIEKEIAQGRTFANIVKHLPDNETNLDAGALQRHYDNGHMPMEAEAVRRIVEQRANELGRAQEDGANELVDQHVLARTVVQKTQEAIVAGKLEPTVNDGIQAAKLLQQMGIDEEAIDQTAYLQAFIIFHETAQEFMSPNDFAQFGKRLSQNVVLQGLINKAQNQASIEGEVVAELDTGEN